MTDTTKNCGSCKLLLVNTHDKNGNLVAKKGVAYRCGFVLPRIPLPVSITDQHDYRPDPYHRYHMTRDMGEDCPTWESKV